MQHIVITGANRGLGFAFTQHLLKRDDTTVYATCRKPDDAEALQNLKNDYADRLQIVPLDVIDQESIEQSVQEVGKHTSGVDVLINNAAINPPGRFQSFEALTAEGMLFMFQVNTVAPLMVTKAYVDLLKAGTNARVINISSQMGAFDWKTGGGYYGYSPSKAALNMVTRSMASDLGSDGVTTISVHPGWVQTDMGGPGASLTPDESAKGVIDLVMNLSPEDNGKFFKWTGEIHPW